MTVPLPPEPLDGPGLVQLGEGLLERPELGLAGEGETPSQDGRLELFGGMPGEEAENGFPEISGIGWGHGQNENR